MSEVDGLTVPEGRRESHLYLRTLVGTLNRMRESWEYHCFLCWPTKITEKRQALRDSLECHKLVVGKS